MKKAEKSSRFSGLLQYKMFLLIFVINTIINVGQQMINTLVPKYSSSLGFAATIVGLISGMFSVSALCMRPAANLAFDRFGKKRMLLASSLLMCVAVLLYSFAHDSSMLILARILHGVSYGCIGPLCLALAGDSLPDEKIGSGIGIFTLAQAIAQAIGPGIGLSLQTRLGYAGAFRCGMIVIFSAVLMIFAIKTDQPNPPVSSRLSWNRFFAPEVVGPSVCLFFMAIAQSAIVSFLVIYGGLRGIENVGLYFTVHAIMLFASRPLAGRLSDRFGFQYVVLPGIACSICAFFIISWSVSAWHLAAAAVFAACGYGASQPAIQAMSMKMISPARRAVGANTNYIFTDLGAIVGSWLTGAVIDMVLPRVSAEAEAYAVSFRVMVLPMLLAALSFYIMHRKTAAKEVSHS